MPTLSTYSYLTAATEIVKIGQSTHIIFITTIKKNYVSFHWDSPFTIVLGSLDLDLLIYKHKHTFYFGGVKRLGKPIETFIMYLDIDCKGNIWYIDFVLLHPHIDEKGTSLNRISWILVAHIEQLFLWWICRERWLGWINEMRRFHTKEAFIQLWHSLFNGLVTVVLFVSSQLENSIIQFSLRLATPWFHLFEWPNRCYQ